MKDYTCKCCGEVVTIFDDERRKQFCDACSKERAAKSKKRAATHRQMKDQVMRDCGLVKVRGALGGIYWE